MPFYLKSPAVLCTLAAVTSFGALALSDVSKNAPSDAKQNSKNAVSASTTKAKIEALQIASVHNAFRVSPKLISGSQPEGEAAFKALAALGVKTIITVDGAKPDVEGAKKYGMRYVQIPFGYDNLPRQQSLTLARAVRELPGQIYLHCHHGKHRSPVAAACVLIANDGWSNDEALSLLKAAGTGANYTGLWDDVRSYKAPTEGEIDKASGTFPAVAPLPPLVKTMVRMDELVEHLQATQKANWKALAEHPDLDAPHEALMLREIYTELQRDESIKKRPADFKNWLAEGEKHSENLEDALRAGDAAKAEAAMTQITSNCSSCHAVYRNVSQKVR